MNQVYLVNDAYEVCDRTAAMLIELGWDVYVASGEEQLFESMVARRPDLLVVDIEIECGDGFKAISTARTLFPTLFIVAVTRGQHASLWEEAARECGANIYLIGPISRSKLVGAIEIGINSRAISCELAALDSPVICRQ